MRSVIPRPGAAVVLVSYWALMTLVAVNFGLPWETRLVQYSSVIWFAGIALAIAVGLYAARWWLLAAAPIVVLGAVELAGHRAPWESSGPPLTQYLWWPLLWILTWFFVLPLTLGIAVRRGLGERGQLPPV